MQNYIVIARNLDDEDQEEDEILYEAEYDSWYLAEEKFNVLTKLHSSSTSLIEVELYCLNGTGDFGSDTNKPGYCWWNAPMNDYQMGDFFESISIYDSEKRYYIRLSEEELMLVASLYNTFQVET